jgi:putative hydrolase of the HAD superfamily
MGELIPSSCNVDAILFDFGGVLAEEGFRNGLSSIARLNGLDPESFSGTGSQLVFEIGYVTGQTDESTFWNELRKKTGVKGSDEFFRSRILSHFILRPYMFELVRKLKDHGLQVAILSDQTQWLDELNARYDLFKWFDHVFNSYHLGQSKKDPATFTRVVKMLGLSPGRILFVDDDGSNVERAARVGLQTVRYVDRETFFRELYGFCPFLESP